MLIVTRSRMTSWMTAPRGRWSTAHREYGRKTGKTMLRSSYWTMFLNSTSKFGSPGDEDSKVPFGLIRMCVTVVSTPFPSGTGV